MYEKYYDLTGPPFALTPDSRFYFASRAHARAVAHLTFGLAQGEGFVVVTGEVGAGKTTMIEHLLSLLDRDAYAVARISTTQVSNDDLFRLAMAGFGIDTPDASKSSLLLSFEDVLREHRLSGQRCLLIVDEVQNLSLAALEELRMLSNLTEGGRASLQTILLGQPQFRRTLASPELDQLRQRVLASYHLGPLSRDETRGYIQHRMSTVGWRGSPHWHDAAFAAVFDHSGGIPRRINRLCARVLLYGALEEVAEISGAMVENAADELAQDLESGGFATNGSPLNTGPLNTGLGVPAMGLPGLAGGGVGGGVSPSVAAALGDLRDRMEILEAQVAKRDRVFQRLLTLLGSEGLGN